MSSSADLHIYAAWIGILGGFVCGAVIGLFFHEEQWLGGYGSYRRRMLRLGHVSFFGLGFVNFAYGATLKLLDLRLAYPQAASAALLVGAATMPVCCFLAAWRKPLRHLFPIPVLSLLLGVVLLLSGWRA
jgi:Na+/H+-dicarboxylate symporter